MGNSLKNKNIVIGVTGSIACYKVLDLIKRLKKLNSTVYVIMTESATKLVSVSDFENVADDVKVHLFDPNFNYKDYIKKYTDKLSVLGSDEYIIHYEEIKAMQNEIDGLRHKVNEKMSPLTRVIKKYIYLQPDVLLFSYIENACEAVEHDSRFEIGEKLSTYSFSDVEKSRIEIRKKIMTKILESLREEPF